MKNCVKVVRLFRISKWFFSTETLSNYMALKNLCKAKSRLESKVILVFAFSISKLGQIFCVIPYYIRIEVFHQSSWKLVQNDKYDSLILTLTLKLILTPLKCFKIIWRKVWKGTVSLMSRLFSQILQSSLKAIYCNKTAIESSKQRRKL